MYCNLCKKNNGTYVDSKGVERISINYYLVFDNGTKICIKPAFTGVNEKTGKKSNDYQVLYIMSDNLK